MRADQEQFSAQPFVLRSRGEAEVGSQADDTFDLCDLATLVQAGHAAPRQQDDPFGMLGISGAYLQFDPMQAGSAARPTDAAIDLFDGLNEEFVRAVQDPTQLAGPIEWRALPTSECQPAPTLDELSESARPYALLRDILLPREDVGLLIGTFDPLGEFDLFDVAETEDVLRLFAPQLARDAVDAIPSLTRKEHHAASIDSPLRLGDSRVCVDPGDPLASSRWAASGLAPEVAAPPATRTVWTGTDACTWEAF